MHQYQRDSNRGVGMPLKIITLSCIGCGLGELACCHRRDGGFTVMHSSIMLHIDDRRNYFGVMIKPSGELVLGALAL